MAEGKGFTKLLIYSYLFKSLNYLEYSPKYVSQTQNASFRLFNVSSLCSVIITTLQIKRTLKHTDVMTAINPSLSYLDRGLSSAIVFSRTQVVYGELVPIRSRAAWRCLLVRPLQPWAPPVLHPKKA